MSKHHRRHAPRPPAKQMPPETPPAKRHPGEIWAEGEPDLDPDIVDLRARFLAYLDSQRVHAPKPPN
jgi:hypothetical protein